MKKREREYKRLAEEYGFTAELCNNAHWAFRRDGCETVFASGSPGNDFMMFQLKQKLARSKAGRLSAFRGAPAK